MRVLNRGDIGVQPVVSIKAKQGSFKLSKVRDFETERKECITTKSGNFARY
jgi:hypothetical protein